MRLSCYLLLLVVVFNFSACTSQDNGPLIPGVLGPDINIQNGKILISVELENIDIPVGLTLPVPKLKNSNITLGPASSNGGFGGTLIQVNFAIEDVDSDEFRSVPPELLPDGRPFPFMIDGTLPAIALHVPKAKDMTFYMSNKLFGFFLPLKLPAEFQNDINYRIRINGKSYGVVALIHPDEHGEGSGLVALLTLDDIRNSEDAQKLLKLSKKYKNTVF
ncbi:MAG: hypothetical protein CME62_04435 [Halobacteriovoraceae bacterium]|nr:hypothetical protein [Halobacteriovoraceae bacterium]|tara:strand:+ start:10285 stop:10941 length:657 start_codon:yes stop_codon:yes gene_type:complete